MATSFRNPIESIIGSRTQPRLVAGYRPFYYNHLYMSCRAYGVLDQCALCTHTVCYVPVYFSLTLNSVCTSWYAVAMLLLCCCYAVAMLLLCCCYAVAMLLLCRSYTVTMLLLYMCHCYAVIIITKVKKIFKM